ncbi:STAS domain-containing protein [Geminocystis sp. NIES-3708]|uniref:STAS domain-containing protein n=1 Tax=Geminocystis sp. NIES-3708 TaxID=1615909 RepID=UPI0037BEC247
MTVSLRGTREVKKNCQVFHLLGQLDAFSEPTFQRVILSYTKESANQIILDLSQIDFIDSSGLGALVRIAKHMDGIKGKMQIVSNPRVTQTVKMVRLEKFLNLKNSLDEALKDI